MSVRAVDLLDLRALRAYVQNEVYGLNPTAQALPSQESASILKTHFGIEAIKKNGRSSLSGDKLRALCELIEHSMEFLSQEDRPFFQLKTIQEIWSNESFIAQYLQSIVDQSTVMFFSVFPRFNRMLCLNGGTTKEQATLIRNIAQNVFDEITKIDHQNPLEGVRIIPQEIMRLKNLSKVFLKVPFVTHFPDFAYCQCLESLSVCAESLTMMSDAIKNCSLLKELNLDCKKIQWLPDLSSLTRLERINLYTRNIIAVPRMPIESLKWLYVWSDGTIYLENAIYDKAEKKQLEVRLKCLEIKKFHLLPPLTRYSSCPEQGSNLYRCRTSYSPRFKSFM